jgi:PAS domain-containing protein
MRASPVSSEPKDDPPSGRSGIRLIFTALLLLLLLVRSSFAGKEGSPAGGAPNLQNTVQIHPELSEHLSELLESGCFGASFFSRHAIPMLLIDPESGLVLAGNEAAQNFYGHQKIQGIHVDQIDTISPETLHKACELRRNHIDFRHTSADGSTRDACAYFYPIPFNGGEIVFAMIIDQTERVAAETALRMKERSFRAFALVAVILQSVVLFLLLKTVNRKNRAERRLADQLHFTRSLIDAIPNPVFYQDIPGRILGANREFKRLIGCREEEIAGKSLEEITTGERAEQYRRMNEKLIEDRLPQNYEFSDPGHRPECSDAVAGRLRTSASGTDESGGQRGQIHRAGRGENGRLVDGRTGVFGDAPVFSERYRNRHFKGDDAEPLR